MKNLAEMEDLTPVIEKFSTIAVQVLEGTPVSYTHLTLPTSDLV